MSSTDLTVDELYALDDLDKLLEKVADITKIKLAHRNAYYVGCEAEDVVQEVLIKVSHSLEKYDSRKAKLSTFLDKVITRQIIDCFRMMGSKKSKVLGEAFSVHTEYVEDWNGISTQLQCGKSSDDFEEFDLLIDYLKYSGLTDREKEIFEYLMVGYTGKEVARILGISEMKISNLRKSMRRKIGK